MRPHVLLLVFAACGGDAAHPDARDSLGAIDAALPDAPADCTQPAVRCVGAGQEYTDIQTAANDAVAGDQVIVFAGTYGGFVSVASGTAASPIVFEGYAGAVIATPTDRGDGINIENTDYVTVSGFDVRGATRAGIRSALSRGVVIRRNHIDATGASWGILTGFAVAVVIEDNVAFHATNQHGIYVSNSTDANDNPIIRRNEVYGNAESGIQLNGDCNSGGDGVLSGALIEGNLVHDNGGKGFSLISMQSSVVQNNVIWNNGITNGAGGIHLTDEIGCGNPSNDNLIVSNTIFEPRIAAIRATDAATGNVVFDNIAIGSSGGIADEVGTNSIDVVSNTVHGASASMFVNLDGADLHELATSATVNAGVSSYQGRSAPATDRDGMPRPSGAAYDVGAYEQ